MANVMCTRGTRWRDYAIFSETISYIALKCCLSKSTSRDRESPAECEKSTKLEIIIFGQLCYFWACVGSYCIWSVIMWV